MWLAQGHPNEHRAHQLVDSLNELLTKLDIHLPFALETPFDLTPGLLLGILESILESRLPIPPEIRASRDFTNKVQAMKIFLGVLESDILGGEDVGLSDVDPRRLAAGEEEEVEFVGELLCWLGKQRGILAGSSRDDVRPPALSSGPGAHHHGRRASSPSTHSTVTSGAHSNLSMMRTTLAETDTTMSAVSEPLAPLAHPELPELPSLPQVPVPGPSRRASGRAPPRCIHELEDPSFAFDPDMDVDAESTMDTSLCHCDSVDAGDDLPPTPTTPVPHRYDGWIDNADENAELQFYYQRRSPPTSAPSSSGGSSRRIITPHNAPTEYTLALLNERARLLDELARMKGTPVVQ
ncbi:hypothetical protein C8Q76DRAFT_677139 [Earliella scabrosa]|nr:hypothetical protein C8Q76DRAFT_677139 [Earliella scabrosa]